MQPQDIEARLRMYKDLGRRPSAGNWVYSIAWPVVYLSTELHDHFPWQGWLLQVLFVGMAFWRSYHMRLVVRWLPTRETLWLAIFYPISLISISIWGAINALALLYGSNELMVVMAISLVGFTSGAINNVAPSLTLARAFMACALLPMAAGVFIGSSNAAFILVVLMFFTYLMVSSKQQNTEYWLLVSNEYRLRDQQRLLEQMSRTDVLTGLGNRRYFNEKFDDLWKQSQRQRTPLAVLMVDIDHFKRINDSYGHGVGDECLAFVSERLTATIRRATDVVARIGGEEFALLLPFTDAASAVTIAEKLRTAIANTPFQHRSDNDGASGNQLITTTITVSIGIAVGLTADYRRQEELMSAADHALYQSKHEGRNRCTLHTIESVSLKP